MVRSALVLHVAWLGLAGSIWSANNDESAGLRTGSASDFNPKEQTIEKGIAQRRLEHTARQSEKWRADRDAMSQTEADRQARIRAKQDEAAAMRPLVQAQRKKEWEQKKRAQEDEAKRLKAEEAVRIKAEALARESVMKELQDRMEAKKLQAEKEARKMALRKRWEEVKAQKEAAAKEAALPEDARKQLQEERAKAKAAEAATAQIELERKREKQQRRQQKEERDRAYKSALRAKEAAVQEAKRKAEEREQRRMDYDSKKKAIEERKSKDLAAKLLSTEAHTSHAINPKSDDTVRVWVSAGEGLDAQVRVTKASRLQVLLSTAAHRLGLDAAGFRFMHNGAELHTNDSVDSINWEDNDLVLAEPVL